MKTRIILFVLILSFSLSLFSELVHSQGFEASVEDTWSYTANPESNRLVWWGRTDQPLGGASAQNGSWYWASWDLDNINHSLVFEQLILEPGYIYDLSFWYYTVNLSSAEDYCRYALSFDGGNTWEPVVNLNGNIGAWSLAEVEIPAYANSLMLKVESLYDGFSKYAHWDSFSLHRTETPPMAPTIYNIQAAQRRDGSKLIDISYQLFDANNDASTVSLYVSLDSGVTYSYQPAAQNLSGDFGDGIPSGTAGNIVWNAAAEGIDFDSATCCIVLQAEDHTTGTVETPVFSLPGGTYIGSQIVSISSATEGAAIYYTTNGSTPDQSSMLYTAPITIANNVTLKARAYKELWVASEIAEAAYFINDRFVYVPGGTFTMGDTRSVGSSSELPTHSVTLNSFYIGKYQVTQAEYAQYMQPGSSWTSSYGLGGNYPAYYVSWYAAIKYCNLRSMAEGLTPVYSISGSTNPANWGSVPTSNNSTWNAAVCNWTANGYRLPTEAEWEYAARGATNNPDYLYSGSDDINAVAWYSGNNSPSGSKPVGTKAPNGLGIYDMSGNLWEWCWDWWGSSYYSSSPSSNPTGPTSGSYRVRRGGVWNGSATYCPVAYRVNYSPSNAYNSIGLRLCRAGL